MCHTDVKYTVCDKCSYDEVLSFIQSVEGDFTPSLFSRINAKQYINKILSKASINTCRHNGEIIGMIAAYDNSDITHEAYITFLAVDSFWRHHDIASKLLELTELSSKLHGMTSISVSTCSPTVVRLYEKNAFVIDKTEYDVIAKMNRFFLKKT